jgi:hypothetical protein
VSEGNRTLAAALAYAGRGWAIHPIRAGDKRPYLHDWPHRATTEPKTIRQWWAKWPEANVGLACGPSRLTVVDLDVKGGAGGPASWDRLLAALGFAHLPTPASRTPSGGRHLFFAAPQPAPGNSAGRLGPGIDTRGEGGYVLLPPSTLAGGGAYTWEVAPGKQDPPHLPAALAGLLSRPEAPRQATGGGREAAYATAALSGEVARVAAAPRGTRNDTLNAAAFALGQLVAAGLLDRAEVERRLLGAAQAAGLEDREAGATLKSGLDAGRKQPRPAPGGGRKQPRSLPEARPGVPSGKEGAAGHGHPAPGPSSGPGLSESRQRSTHGPCSCSRETPSGFSSASRAADCYPPRAAGEGTATCTPAPQAAQVSCPEGELPPLPDFAYLPPDLGRDACPWLDDYVRFSRTWSPRSFEGFHEACGLWLLSTVAARRVVVHYGRPRFTNLYFLLAGRTTMHAKSSATDIARGLLRACGLDYLLAADEATPQAFVRALAGGALPANYDALDQEQQLAARLRLGFCGQRGWYAEEFGTWLASMMRTDGVMADFRGLLRKLDDCPPDYSRSTIARGDEVVQRPYLALIANLTPADLRPVARRGAQLWGDGFLARFAFITPPREEVLVGQFPKGQRSCPRELTAPLVEWHRQLGLPVVHVENEAGRNGVPTGDKKVTVDVPEPQECRLPGEVWEAVDRYNRGVLQIAGEGKHTDLDGNYGRFHEKALRVAALLASLENGGRVEMRHWARAQEVAERWRLHAHRLYEQVGELEISPQAELEDKVLDAVRRWQGSEKYPGGLTAADIARFVWGWGAVEVKRCADGLVSAHVLAKHRPGRAERYFEPGPEAEEGTIEEKRNRSVEAAAGQAHDIYRSPAGRGDQQEE